MMVSVMLRLFYYLSDARTGAEIYRRDRHLVPGGCRRDLCHACARESTVRTCMRAGFNPFDPNYQEMGDIAEAYTSVFTADAAAVLIMAFKTLKYFKLQRDLSMMRDTLAQARCGRDATEMRLRCDGDATEMRRRYAHGSFTSAIIHSQAGKDLIVFMLLMLGLLLGFIVMGNNIFGTQALIHRRDRDLRSKSIDSHGPPARSPMLILGAFFC